MSTDAQPAAPPAPPKAQRDAAAWAGLWLVYTLLQAATPSFDSPFGPAPLLAPAAGLALAATAVWGRPWLLLLPLASWLADGLVLGVASLLGALTAALQAAGVLAMFTLTRDHSPMRLERGRDILLQLVAPALAASLLGALPWAAAAWWRQGPETAAFLLLAHTGADLGGMLLVAPIVLCVIGQPRGPWLERRLTLALPLAATLGLITAAIVELSRLDLRRAQATFDNDARTAIARVEAQLETAMGGIDALHGAMLLTQAQLSASQFDVLARPWLSHAIGVSSLGWHARVDRAELAAFEAAAVATGEAGFRVHNRPDGVPEAVTAADPFVLAMRHGTSLSPDLAMRKNVLGINVLSIPGVRATALRALEGGPARASPAFLLTGLPDQGLGLVVYRALRQPDGRMAGLSFATIYLEQALTPARAGLPDGLLLCVVDLEPGVHERRLAGTAACAYDTPGPGLLRRQENIEFGGRLWQLRAQQAQTEVLRSAGSWSVWVFAAPAMLGAALLGCLLLLSTGRAQREARERQVADALRVRAESANRAKNHFIANMSHELRTPLNAILGFAQVLAARAPAGAGHSPPELQRIQQAGWHLLAMINDVLDLSLVEGGSLSVQATPLSLQELVGDSVALLDAQAARRGVSMAIEISDAACAVRADPVRLRQVLVNLLSNAIKYNRAGGQVLVSSARESDGRIAITVHDTGLGMDAGQLASLFEPFNRLGRERSGVEGTGIGLVIAKRLTELMQGSLHASSVPGEGSSFRIVLPEAERPAAPAEAVAADTRGGVLAVQRVLCIEDNETNVEILRAMLALQPGIELQVASTAAAGLAMAFDGHPDLLLLDLGLPDMDGLSLLRCLRADSRTARLAVVVVSARVMEGELQAAMDAGASDCLAKPLELAALRRVLARHLGVRLPGPEARMALG